MKNNKILMILSTSILISPSVLGCKSSDKTTTDKDCLTIKNNYKEYIKKNTNIDQYKFSSVSEIKSELETKKIAGLDTYYFKDIDYSIDNIRSSWAAAGHISRALKIAIIAENRNDDELKDIAKKLTLHWGLSNYHNINWWQNELGANSNLANLGLFTFDYLGKKGQDAFNGKIRESSLKYRPSVSTHTGANVIDYIDITCRNAAINNDKDEMNIAFNRLKDEVTDDKIEGFQKDGSFFQHGRQVQNVSYGKSIIRIGKTLYNLRNTNYQMPDDKMSILSSYILNGLRGSTFKGYTNYNTVSREFSRVNNLDTQANGFKELSYYLDLPYYPSDKKEDTKNFIDSLANRENAIKKDTIQYFPIAKMIIANIGHDDSHEGIYISYKASEPNLTNTECVNGENRLGLNLTYGTNTCVMDNGNEYFNISPIMNYNYMPGTSSVLYGDKNDIKSQDEAILKAVELYGDTELGNKLPVANESNGYIYNDGQDQNVTYSMLKSKHDDRTDFTLTCIATYDGMVFIGSGLKFTNKDGESQDDKIHTTVDRYITDDDVKASESSISFKNHNDGNVTYKSLVANQNLVKTIEERSYTSDDWKRNNRDLSTTDSGKKNVATITIEGENITSYAYAIQPSISTKEFKLASNSNDVHAIELANNKIVTCFYKKDATFNYESKEYKLDDQSKFITGKGAFVIFDKK